MAARSRRWRARYASISLDKPLDEAESPLLEAESLRARSAAARELGERADRVRWSASMTARAPSAWRRPRSTCQSGTSTRKASVAVRRSMGSGSAQPSFVAILPAIVGCGLRRGIVLRSGHAQAAQRTIDISFLQHTWPCSMWWPCGMPFAKELDECATDSSRLSGILCSYRSYWKPRRALRPSGCNQRPRHGAAPHGARRVPSVDCTPEPGRCSNVKCVPKLLKTLT